MNDSLLVVLGLISGAFMAVSGLPYVRDILRHKTKPERATWWVWTGLGVLAVIAQFQAGNRWSLAMTVASVLACVVIAFLSVSHGYGKFKAKDTVALIVAALGMLLSQVLHSPLVALLIIIAVDAVGYSLTIAKTWEAPETETLSTWVLSTLGGFFGCLAVGSLNFAQVVYPAYIFLGNTIMIAIILLRRKTLRTNLQDSSSARTSAPSSLRSFYL
jgi:hypothetical protein